MDRLNEGRQGPLTLISAPAGYGKSTLASLWMAECDCPSGWVSLGKSDSDLRIFLSYVLAAIYTMFSEIEFRTKALLQASQLPSALVLADYLLNDLHQIAEPFILVLDDYHHIEESLVHDLVAALLAHPAEAMHLVLVTRHDPSPPIATLRGRGQVTEIRGGDLRFTPAEAAAFLSKMLKVPVDDDTAALLDKKVEGWATGLHLAGLYLRDTDDPKALVQELSGSSRHIAEYLISEVLSKQDPEMKACLIETSILDRFCAPLMRQMHPKGATECSESQTFFAEGFIEWLVKNNLFVIPLDNQGHWFRYHHLFKEFLGGLLRKQLSTDQIAGLHRIARDWFAENGLIEEAIQYSLAAGDTAAAVQLVVDHRCALMNNSEFHRVNRWLAMLPDDAIANAPLLVTTRGLLSVENGQVADIFTSMEQAKRLLAALPPESAERAALKGEAAVLQSIVKVLSGESAEALAAAREALESLPRESLYVRTLAIGAMAVGCQMEGDLNQAVDLLKGALKLSGISSAIQSRIWIYFCIVNFTDANASGVLSVSRRALELASSLHLAHTRSFLQYFIGATHYMRNELAEAKSYLLGVLEEHAVASPTYVAHASSALAFIALAEGCPEGANEAVDFVAPNFWEISDAYSAAVRDALRVELSLRQGMVNEAQRRSVGVDFNAKPPLWFLYVPQLTPIKLLLAKGTDQNLKEARARLVELDEKMRRINRKNVRIEILSLLALVCDRLGEKTAAFENLQTSLSLAEPGGWIRRFIDLGPPMAHLLERFVHLQPGHQFARRVLAAFGDKTFSGSPTAASSEDNHLSISGQSGEDSIISILTNRELNVLHFLEEGLTNKEIAEKLFVSPETVKKHAYNIYRKLKVRTRLQAVATAKKLGLLPAK